MHLSTGIEVQRIGNRWHVIGEDCTSSAMNLRDALALVVDLEGHRSGGTCGCPEHDVEPLRDRPYELLMQLALEGYSKHQATTTLVIALARMLSAGTGELDQSVAIDMLRLARLMRVAP